MLQDRTDMPPEQDTPTQDAEIPPLRLCVAQAVKVYFDTLEGEQPSDLYELFLAELEQPLFEKVLQETRGNQSKCADILGINRGTLRKKLKTYGML